MYTTFNAIGLEDWEKKRGLVDFSMDFSMQPLQIDTIKPRMKKNNEIIIVRDGRAKHTTGKGTELF